MHTARLAFGPSKRVHEIRPLVSKLIDLLLALAFNQMVKLTLNPPLVLHSETDMLYQATAEQEQGFVHDADGVTRDEAR